MKVRLLKALVWPGATYGCTGGGVGGQRGSCPPHLQRRGQTVSSAPHTPFHRLSGMMPEIHRGQRNDWALKKRGLSQQS